MKSAVKENQSRTISPTQARTFANTSKLKDQRLSAKISSSIIEPEVVKAQPEMFIDHSKNQIATIESKIQKLNKKMHTHIIITPPIGTEIANSHGMDSKDRCPGTKGQIRNTINSPSSSEKKMKRLKMT